MILLFLMIYLLVYTILNEIELKKFEKIQERKYFALVKRMKSFKHNQDIIFDYINEMYSELEGGKFEKKM